MLGLSRPIFSRLAYFARSQRLFTTATTPVNFAAPTASMSPEKEALNIDWNQFDEFFSYTVGRFLVDEKKQMEQRYRKFNMNALVQVAAQSIRAEDCVAVLKYPDGLYNKCFVLSMSDGREVIAKVPNPNAGIAHYTTASEVATMDFVRNTLETPVPKVYAWNSRADDAVGAEYIVMEKMAGVPLDEVWGSMTFGDRFKLRLDLARYQAVWQSISFRQCGGLYYKQDVESGSLKDHLYKNQKGEKVHDNRFTIGPMTGRDWSDCGRIALQCDRGPWPTPSDYHRAVGLRELAAISSITPLPKQTVMLCGPGLYQPTAAKKSAAVESYLRIYDSLLPSDPILLAPTLWHNDLHGGNIFVDPQNFAKITAIIDWQSIDLLPLFDHNLDPAFISCPDPEPEPETLEPPTIKETPGMSDEERTIAITEFLDEALFIGSRKMAHKKMPAVYRAIKYQRRLEFGFDILIIARHIFEIGEAHVHARTIELCDARPDISSIMNKSASSKQDSSSLHDAFLKRVQSDFDKSVRGMEIMKDFESRLGPLWPDKGVVSHDLYNDAKSALRKLKDEMIAEFVNSEDEKTEFEKSWPFED